MTARRITMLPHDPAWARRFPGEARRLLEVFAGVVLDVHHIGSTAVPGLVAKPILDMMVVVRGLDGVDAARPAAEAAGYRWLGEHGIAGRRYLTRDGGAEADVHVHTFAVGDPNVERHLDFRDYLLCHTEHAARYGRLKRDLAERYATDRVAYTDAKTAFVRETEALARAWRRSVADGGSGESGATLT